jgi:polyisoprenoid-binding protein YceI
MSFTDEILAAVVISPRQTGQELENGLRDHVERKTEEYVDKGLTPSETMSLRGTGEGGCFMRRRLTIGWSLLLVATTSFAAEKFPIDSGHSKVGLTVALAGVTDVDGRFADFDGTISYDEADLTKSSVTAIIKTASIDTGNSSRDNDLRGANFFDANKYPTIRFQSKSIQRQGNDYVMTGTLTIRDVTRDVVIPLVWRQHKTPDPWQNTRIGFEGRLTLQRKEYGVVGPTFWNNAISDAVEIELRITAQKPNFDRWNFQAPPGKKPIGAVVYDAVEKEGLESALRQYKELKQQQQDSYAFGAGQLNLVGRKLLQHGKNKEALEILKLNAEMFPTEAAVFDSVGDAFTAVGDTESAAQSFKRSLAIDPTDTSAIESLRRLPSR